MWARIRQHARRSRSPLSRRGRWSRSRPSLSRKRRKRHNPSEMKAEQVIATHANTDYGAFASMLAPRRLWPGAFVCLAGSLNRNVREFYRLHADELDFVVDASRLELDASRRLIVVETVHAARLGELEPVALDPAVDKVVFDHHSGEELPEWATPENVVVSEDGALTTTLVGVLAEREVSVSPLEATVFALGIH